MSDNNLREPHDNRAGAIRNRYKSDTPKALGGLSQTLAARRGVATYGQVSYKGDYSWPGPLQERLPMARLLAGVVSCAKAPVGAVAYGQTASMSDLLRLRAPAYRLPAGRSALAHRGDTY
ncbi:hypothetical protein B296_00011311 [Ensete ventricosum]|uniref:Uncharacterized protein n=1 Tax=Ensete ventricosum TaxID=4639 RepID=A0A427AMG8_ENSVE|nr:hypothetical protein B296_00011311 [Ensete ventricosum]